MLVWLTVGTEPNPITRRRQKWAENLKLHMKYQGISRKALRLRLADLGVTVTEQAIGCWLRAETAPRAEHQAALAAILEAPVHLLFPIEPVAA